MDTDQYHFEVYLNRTPSTEKLYYWHAVTQAGEFIACSVSGYKTKEECLHALHIVTSFAVTAPIAETIDGKITFLN